MRIKQSYYHIYIRSLPIIVTLLTTLILFRAPFEYGDKKSIRDGIEEMINSKTNQGECKIPDLAVDSPDLTGFYEHNTVLKCGEDADDWVTCIKSHCFIKPFIASSRGNITCFYSDLIREADRISYYGQTVETYGEYYLKDSDFVSVQCIDEIGTVWTGLACGIRDTVNRTNPIPTKYPPYNVVMIGFGSLSRNTFIRKLPITYDYLVNTLGAVVLQGYNIVGAGSKQALIPILTGLTELELPEIRRRIPNSMPANVFPMIWKEYEKSGYYTAFNEDLSSYGIFSERLNGFEKQPTHHFLKTLFFEADSFSLMNDQFCIGSKPSHTVMLEYTKNFMDKYADYPKFAFSFHSELSGYAMRYIANADDMLTNFLSYLKQKDFLDNTILIVMSDHGYRFTDNTKSLQGKQEERLPFFSFRFPFTFKIRNPKKYQNFQENAHRLTTPFDIHETLVDILRLQSKEHHKPTSQQPTHGISLFNQIPKNRSCADAYIPPQWCACLNWFQMNDTSSSIVKIIANKVVTTINYATDRHRDVCQLLEIKQIKSILVVAPHKELMKYKQSKDIDEFIPDFSSDMESRIINKFYQIEIEMHPGGLVFMATVNFNTKAFTARTRLSQIQRVDKYDDQVSCLSHIRQSHKKFCYCESVSSNLNEFNAKSLVNVQFNG